MLPLPLLGKGILWTGKVFFGCMAVLLPPFLFAQDEGKMMCLEVLSEKIPWVC